MTWLWANEARELLPTLLLVVGGSVLVGRVLGAKVWVVVWTWILGLPAVVLGIGLAVAFSRSAEATRDCTGALFCFDNARNEAIFVTIVLAFAALMLSFWSGVVYSVVRLVIRLLGWLRRPQDLRMGYQSD